MEGWRRKVDIKKFILRRRHAHYSISGVGRYAKIREKNIKKRPKKLLIAIHCKTQPGRVSDCFLVKNETSDAERPNLGRTSQTKLFPVGPRRPVFLVVWSDTRKRRAGHVVYLPHIDEILCQCHGVRIPSYSNRAIRCSAFPFLTVADSDHGARDLTDLGDLGTALSNDATDQLIWHSHFMCLIVRRRLLSVGVTRTQLASGQCG